MLVHCTMMCNEACTTVFAQGCVVHAMYNTSLYNVQWYLWNVQCTKMLVQCTMMCKILAQGCFVQCTMILVQQQPISSLSTFQPRRPKPQHQTFTQLSNKQFFTHQTEPGLFLLQQTKNWEIQLFLPQNTNVCCRKYNCFYQNVNEQRSWAGKCIRIVVFIISWFASFAAALILIYTRPLHCCTEKSESPPRTIKTQDLSFCVWWHKSLAC